MAFISGKDFGALFVGSADVVGQVGGVRMKHSAVVDSRRLLGATWPTVIDTGQRNGELELTDVVYDSSLNQNWAPLPTSYVACSACIHGDTSGTRFWGFQSAVVSGIGVDPAQDRVDDIAPQLIVRGAVDVGWVVTAKRTGASGMELNDSPGYVDMGAAATNGRGYLHLTALTRGGYTSVTVKVQHSTDHSTWADLVSFTANTAVGAECKAITGTINRYLKTVTTWAGSGSSESYTIFVGVGTD